MEVHPLALPNHARDDAPDDVEVHPLALPNHARDDAPDDVVNARGAWRQRRMHEARAQFAAKQKARATAAGQGSRRDEAFLNA
jgi:hypothetical protein